jgi:hypothetical protein
VSSLAVNSTITAPSSNRSYRIINADATYSLTIKASGQTGVTFLPGQTGVVAFNGTDYVIVGVVGAGTATDNAVARFDGTTGEIIQNSVVTIADSTGDVAGVGTLTMGGNLTLNGGTANGVLYLNGSKVATSGSALTFDGTNLVNLGGVVRALAAATQDALQLQGRAGGTSSYITTLTPGTLTASNTLTLPVGNTTLAGLAMTQTFSGAQTFSSSVTMSGTTTNIALGTSQTSGTWTAGGAAQTGTITLDQSTKAHTLNIGTGATENATTKTINIGTAGVSGSTTNLTYGSGVTGSTTTHIWNSGGSEAMRLTSTGLGIGTSSPQNKLHVDGGSFATNTGNIARFDNSATTAYNSGAFVGGSLRVNYGNATNSYGGINFSNFGATSQEFFGVVQNSSGYGNFVWQGFNGVYGERMRLDSSGNLGLGVTPSAWGTGAPWRVMDIQGGSFFSNGTLNAGMGMNWYNNGTNYIYKATGPALEYELAFDGTHRWYTAPSGTAGNAITFTQAMTLDASGNLLVGTTSPLISAAGRGNITLNGDGAIIVLAKSGTDQGYLFTDGNEIRAATTKAIPLTFYTNSSERARITSGGDLLVGRTTYVDYADAIGFSPAVGSGSIISIGHPSGTASGRGYIIFGYNNGGVGSITQDGTTGVLYNLTSDRRLKDNIVQAPSASDDIDAIQIVSHGWKSAPDEHVKYGVIAQDLYAVAPQAVKKGDDGVDVIETWGVDYSKLVPMLVKEIQSLRQRVAQLEGTQP